MTHPLLSLRNITVELGGKCILNGVSAQIMHGQITALIGPDGSGKTTLLRTMLGENAYRGEIRFHCGHDHTKPMPEHIGYVPKKLNIDAKMPLTVRDLLAMALQRRPLFLGVGGKTARQIEAIIDKVGASRELLTRPIEKISGGELQRVLLGLAIHPHPEVLFLDQPAARTFFSAAQKVP